MIIGGEFYEDTRWRMDTPTISTKNMVFLNGGKACLLTIGACLLDHNIQKILLPAYLCPSIVNPLEQSGLTCDYYQVNPDFSIDLDDLASKVINNHAVYFINYFGFLPVEPVRRFLINLQQSGMLLIEDNAQAGFTAQPIGDFVLNSMRKLTGSDGGYLLSRFDVTPFITDHPTVVNRRLPLIRQYRRQLAEYLFQGRGSHTNLTRLYAQAESYYESDRILAGDSQERENIEHQDWQQIKQIRRDNYAYLLSRLAEIPELVPIFPALQPDNLPLGLPVYVTGVPRDWLFDELGKGGIGLTIHWEEILHDPRLNGNPVAVDMASRILTLVIDQRISHKQLDAMIQKLGELINSVNIKVPG